jgi:CBS domain-containing protein
VFGRVHPGVREPDRNRNVINLARRARAAGHREATMTVQAILSEKGTDVFTIEPTATLEAAIDMLATRKIGALVVLGADRRVIGILSERDIVRALAEQGAAALKSALSQVMTRKVQTCAPSETVSVIMERMTTGKFRHIPVLDHNELVGIISIGDVVKHRLMEMERESNALRDYIQTA